MTFLKIKKKIYYKQTHQAEINNKIRVCLWLLSFFRIQQRKNPTWMKDACGFCNYRTETPVEWSNTPNNKQFGKLPIISGSFSVWLVADLSLIVSTARSLISLLCVVVWMQEARSFTLQISFQMTIQSRFLALRINSTTCCFSITT